MRVIAGDARGQRLKAPKGSSVRPTADRVKESLFNILRSELAGARVLDLFAGTGSLAIEALSRGATEALLVDSSAISAKLIRDNLRRLGLTRSARVIMAPVRRALNSIASQGRPFDIIFLDPPYGEELLPQTIEIIAREKLLGPSGVIVAEHSTRDALQERYGPLERVDQRRYGDTRLSFYRVNSNISKQGQ